MNIIRKLKNRIQLFFKEPIPVFVFHRVGDVLDETLCAKDDWTETHTFYNNILTLQNKYKFISLTEAINHLKKDIIRKKKYAVLTTDDGLQCFLNVSSWLEEHNIPTTIFVNSKFTSQKFLTPHYIKYLTKSTSNIDTERIAQQTYMSMAQIESLESKSFEIGLHGYEHLNARDINQEQFSEEIVRCINDLKGLNNFVPYYAYPWGAENKNYTFYLQSLDITPILTNNATNIKFQGYINRFCIDNMNKNQLMKQFHIL